MSIYNYPLFIIKPIALLGRYFPKAMLQLRFYRKTGRKYDLKNPQKLQDYSIAKLFDPTTDLQRYAMFADKYEVREYIKEKIGEQYLTRLYGVYKRAEDIDFDALPDKFVLKTNNGCGNNIIVRDKSELNVKETRKKLDYWLHFPYGNLTGQTHYSLIPPRIIAEGLLEQNNKDKEALPCDYKFFCFMGKPYYVLYYEGRRPNGHITPNMLFDMEWNPHPEAVLRPTDHDIPCPQSFELMTRLVTKIAQDVDFARIDFYEIDGNPIFGEITLTPDIDTNIRPQFDKLIDLPAQYYKQIDNM